MGPLTGSGTLAFLVLVYQSCSFVPLKLRSLLAVPPVGLAAHKRERARHVHALLPHARRLQRRPRARLSVLAEGEGGCAAAGEQHRVETAALQRLLDRHKLRQNLLGRRLEVIYADGGAEAVGNQLVAQLDGVGARELGAGAEAEGLVDGRGGAALGRFEDPEGAGRGGEGGGNGVHDLASAGAVGGALGQEKAHVASELAAPLDQRLVRHKRPAQLVCSP
mmetsp:Transcript_52865/g.105928  ORF Transcript_52865/g.105928 Transcript_52865/m.105928 type:complete len:221 (+) Transcript_52865:191-853(+)